MYCLLERFVFSIRANIHPFRCKQNWTFAKTKIKMTYIVHKGKYSFGISKINI